ncbi:MAG TPA: chromosome segregation protein SMC [Candidatus Hydrogenedentes bacterium]|nr:chromosome segregation protein SMC [Candidatus Hydrogenedentota bacterium]HOL75470.1 chromosome segregation protein SMC [Candidatus Hydrogenedentota bacterium]HPO86088.1 chromosome segregation protein SMC [Candidatus Hydrogenedentota bacterium]
MYFKQLEIIGFKSFADRTVIQLEPGITAIVGPNGSGKSNILDAIRWVLGEQRTRELRGSTMQDVIFNGSETRPATGMAEVSVVFDNADSSLPVDFAEVQITRRLYRSGESEYLINRTPCRLRDIQDLFLDTGIGVNAYSLIGQGKMDLILSQKPEDRRFIFEEAAGILKYKMRKRLALKRLESAEQNLTRLGDIVAEVERQMRSLKRQVHAAMRYRELNEQLRQLEIRAAWGKYRALEAALSVARSQLKNAQERFEELSTKVTALEARHEELGLAKLEADRELLAAREKVHGILTEIDRIENRIALLKQQIVFCQEQQERAKTEQVELQERSLRLQESLEQVRLTREAIFREHAACVDSVRVKTLEQNNLTEKLAEAERRLEKVRQASLERVNDRARIQAELETLQKRLEELAGQFDALQRRKVEHENRRTELHKKWEVLEKEKKEKQSCLVELTEKLSDLKRRELNLEDQIRAIHQEIQSLRERKSSLAARLASLRELRDSYEGFAIGVRAIMRAKSDQIPGMEGVIGPAGDLVNTDKLYEKAIEAALGGNINNVIVEDSETAKRAVQFLKEHAAGRVTFLPLDIIRSSESLDYEPFLSRTGVIGKALDFVQYDPHIHAAVEYLFFNVLLVNDLEVALVIARVERRFPRLVTLEGELVTPAGAVTGGRVKHEGRGVLGRAAEITQLEKDIQLIEKHSKELEQSLTELVSAKQGIQNEFREATEAQKRLDREIIDLGTSQTRLLAQLQSEESSQQQVERELSGLAEQQVLLQNRREVLLGHAGAFEDDTESYEQRIAEAQNILAQFRLEADKCSAELADLRISETALSHRCSELEREISRLELEKSDLEKEFEKRGSNLVEYHDQQRQIEQVIGQETQNLVSFASEKEAAHRKVVDLESQRQKLLDETDIIEKSLKEAREQLRTTQNEFHQLELQVRSDEDKLQFTCERILTEYGIALATLSEESVGKDDFEDSDREKVIADLRQRLQRMGDVNLMAIEEYEALEKRYAFLKAQCDDLRQAKETLLGVIAKSDKKIREMFMETFQRIAVLFNDYFRRLFNGGQARLYLLDEDDPLESGIEIEARPPGKKPTSISLLSGGESALTAIALLCSVLKAKPTPFCILDEVDAPLDDANIGRFLQILEEFAENTQFLVITHSKQTMSRADVLYGVTMQERGVSQIISARLEETRKAGSAA